MMENLAFDLQTMNNMLQDLAVCNTSFAVIVFKFTARMLEKKMKSTKETKSTFLVHHNMQCFQILFFK